MRLGFSFDPDRCFGCLGCVAACANANGTPEDLFWRRVHKLPPEPGSSRTVYLSMACNHCDAAPCAQACPAGALTKRPDGVVQHHPEACIGCRCCQMACPYEAPQWDAARGVISKCGLCHDRLDQGREPACVETCFAGALRLLRLEDGAAGGGTEAAGLIHLPEAGPMLRIASGPPGAFPPALPLPWERP